ncbi:hypothetical protein Poli38472_008662 [Pythium oligandrum]|uniref:Uncharacterized protein n=1 Tax=Pythium oligandrum TaxID=41045 RepID=A0A8K1C3Z5_PYTOL|nr:hypothetical protein Poli38472_008662 [Pythium oligandrum]|eukprot:TMW56014.1 hypothetical protein Poli38472_008662 [Pythium oligandrum]
MKSRALVLLWVLCYVVSTHASVIQRLERLARTQCTDQCLQDSWGSLDDVVAVSVTANLSRASQSQLLFDLGEYHLHKSENTSLATSFFQASADLGTPDAQFYIGALSATSDEQLQADATLYYHFATHSGSVLATMALGYRHFHGYNAVKSCDTALRYYKIVADQVIWKQQAFPVQLYAVPVPTRLADDQTKLPHRLDEDVERAEYLLQRATQPSAPSSVIVRAATLVLFSDLFQPASKHQATHHQAKKLLERAADMGNANAQAMLGHVYSYGLADVAVNATAAMAYYREALDGSVSSEDQDEALGRLEAANGLGLVYYNGVGGQQVDYERAMSYFELAAASGHAEGVYNAAVLMTSSQPRKAHQYFSAAAKIGHVRALFQLARLQEKQRFRGLTDEYSCESTVELYKQVAEHHEGARRLLQRGEDAVLGGNNALALQLYSIAGEVGYEIADSNAAWLLERLYPREYAKSVRYHELVGRGIKQTSADAHVRAGDLAYHKGRYADASQEYNHAVSLAPRHARALFSLGYMYEHTFPGMVQDRHRALWHYEQAVTSDTSMEFVLNLIMWKLQAHMKLMQVYEVCKKAVATIFEGLWSAQDDLKRVNGVVTTTKSSDGITFLSGLEFSGSSHVRLAQLAVPEAFTMDTWLFMHHGSSRETLLQVLLELQDGMSIQLVSVQSADATSDAWRIQISTGLSTKSIHMVPLKAQQWYHLALVVETPPASTRAHQLTLLINGLVMDRLHLKASPPSDPTILSIGQSLTRAEFNEDATTKGFHGVLLQFRVWSHALSETEVIHAKQGRLQPASPDNQALLVDLNWDLTETNRVLNGQEPVTSTDNVALRMIRFPPDQA